MDTQERSVWIFLGERAHWPSGVFTSREAAVRWIAEHHLTGMITEYPVDVGIYDWAVKKGDFRPSKPKHSEPEFIAGFTTARQEHWHFTDGVNDLTGPSDNGLAMGRTPGTMAGWSGTELLCRSLAATGVAGCPQEYFLAEDPAKLPDWRFWEEGPFAAGHEVSDRQALKITDNL